MENPSESWHSLWLTHYIENEAEMDDEEAEEEEDGQAWSPSVGCDGSARDMMWLFHWLVLDMIRNYTTD